MVRSGKWVCFLLLLGFACEDDFQRQLFDYQVERLLTGGSQAVWRPTSIIYEGDQLLRDCADSVLFMFELNTDDSISFNRLRPRCNGESVYDTLDFGKGNASVDSQIFTDSILFSDGDYFLINSIFSQGLTLKSGDTTFQFSVNSQ